MQTRRPNAAERRRTAAIAIAARIRAIAPAAECADPTTPAGAAIADMDAIANGTRRMAADEAAWAIEQAADATAEYTNDGWADPEAAEAAESAAR